MIGFARAARFVSILVVGASAGCASFPGASVGSPVDWNYRWARAQRDVSPAAGRSTSGASAEVGDSSPGIGFYRGVLSRALYSECALFPSDSEYAQFVFRKCGPWHGTLAAMARYYWEPSADLFGDSVIRGRGRLLRVDLSEVCGAT